MACGGVSKRSVEALVVGKADNYLWDDKLVGYGAKVTPIGRRVYLVQYRLGGRKGRTRRLTIGTHGTKTEHEARQEAKRILGEVQSGQDPAAARDKQRDLQSFGHALDHFLRSHVDVKCRPYTAQEYRRVLRLHVPQRWQSRAITDCKRAASYGYMIISGQSLLRPIGSWRFCQSFSIGLSRRDIGQTILILVATSRNSGKRGGSVFCPEMNYSA